MPDSIPSSSLPPYCRRFVPDEDPQDRELAERIREQAETPEPFRFLSTVDADELPEWMLDTLKS